MGQIMSATAALVSIRILTELLPPEEFGRLTLLIGVAALALGLVSTPRLQAVIRFYPQWHNSQRLWVLNQAAITLVRRPVMLVAVVIALVSGFASIFKINAWQQGIAISSLLIIDAVHAFELTFLNAARRQREAAILQTINAWSRPLFAIASTWLFGFKAEVALIGYILGSVLALAITKKSIRFRRNYTKPISYTPQDTKELTELESTMKRYAWPLAPLAIFGWLSGMGDRYIIAGVLSLSEVGIYSAAYGLASRPFLMLSGIIEQTLRPILQNAVAENNKSGIANAKKLMLISSGACSIVGVIFFVFFKDILGNIFFAAEYRQSTTLMPWIALGYGFLCIASVYTRLCYAFDATRYVLILTTAGSLIGILVFIPTTALFGLYGAVLAVPIRFSIELTLSAFLSKKAEANHLRSVHV